MRADQIISRLDPAAPVTRVTDMAFGAVADQINLAIPLPVSTARHAHGVKITPTWLERNTVKRMRVLWPRALNNAFFV
jgi:hypothetical protein